MARYIIRGKRKINGVLRVQGAKNAALPIMAASILNGAETVLHNVPRIKDVQIMKQILVSIGCAVNCEGSTLIINSSGLNGGWVSEKLVSKMRSSLMLIGALIARMRKSSFSYPGGCDIGLRPIDLHLKTLQQLGVSITKDHGYLHFDAENIHCDSVVLDFPSVGVTENIMLASVFTKGITTIVNAAKEPEIVDLQYFLNAMGARVYGAGTNTIYVEGVSRLYPVEYSIMQDRIVSGTYLCALNMCGGELYLPGCKMEYLKAPYYKLIESGCEFCQYKDGIIAKSTGIPRPIKSIVTMPYPSFPTDLQPQFVSMLSVANGVSVVNETVFENRYKYASQIVRMGAKIDVQDRIAIVTGVDELSSATVYAQDLRGGAAIVLAALRANGTSTVENVVHIERGYEDFWQNLCAINCDVTYKF